MLKVGTKVYINNPADSFCGMPGEIRQVTSGDTPYYVRIKFANGAITKWYGESDLEVDNDN